jgi:hypothetical protein
MSNTARQKEAAAEPAKVEWRGHTFEVSRAYADWSVDLVESLEEGKSVGIVRGAIGPDHWRTVKAMNLKMSDLDELSEAIATAMGFGSAGESPASSD